MQWLVSTCRFLYGAEFNVSPHAFRCTDVLNEQGNSLLPYFIIRDYCADGESLNIHMIPTAVIDGATISIPISASNTYPFDGSSSVKSGIDAVGTEFSSNPSDLSLWELFARSLEEECSPIVFDLDLSRVDSCDATPREVLAATSADVPCITGNFISWGEAIPLRPFQVSGKGLFGNRNLGGVSKNPSRNSRQGSHIHFVDDFKADSLSNTGGSVLGGISGRNNGRNDDLVTAGSNGSDGQDNNDEARDCLLSNNIAGYNGDELTTMDVSDPLFRATSAAALVIQRHWRGYHSRIQTKSSMAKRSARYHQLDDNEDIAIRFRQAFPQQGLNSSFNGSGGARRSSTASINSGSIAAASHLGDGVGVNNVGGAGIGDVPLNGLGAGVNGLGGLNVVVSAGNGNMGTNGLGGANILAGGGNSSEIMPRRSMSRLLSLFHRDTEASRFSMASVAGVVASGTVARTGQNSRRQKWQLITRLPACAQLYFTFEFRGVTLLSTDYVICQHRDLSTSESGGRVSTNHCRVPRAEPRLDLLLDQLAEKEGFQIPTLSELMRAQTESRLPSLNDIYSSLYTAITFPAYTPSYFTPVVPIALHSQKSINTAPPMSVALAEQFSLDMASVPYEDLMEAVDVGAVHRVIKSNYEYLCSLYNFLVCLSLSNAPMQLALRDDSTVPASPLVSFFAHASTGTTGASRPPSTIHPMRSQTSASWIALSNAKKRASCDTPFPPNITSLECQWLWSHSGLSIKAREHALVAVTNQAKLDMATADPTMDMARQDFISAPRPPSRLTFNPVPLASATPINSALSGTPGNGTSGVKPISLQRLRSCSKTVAASVVEAEPVSVPSVGLKRLIRMRGDDALISGLDRAVLDGHVTDALLRSTALDSRVAFPPGKSFSRAEFIHSMIRVSVAYTPSLKPANAFRLILTTYVQPFLLGFNNSYRATLLEKLPITVFESYFKRLRRVFMHYATVVVPVESVEASSKLVKTGGSFGLSVKLPDKISEESSTDEVNTFDLNLVSKTRGRGMGRSVSVPASVVRLALEKIAKAGIKGKSSTVVESSTIEARMAMLHARSCISLPQFLFMCKELSLLGLDVSDADDFLPLRENQWTERECSHLVFGAALASENDSWKESFGLTWSEFLQAFAVLALCRAQSRVHAGNVSNVSNSVTAQVSSGTTRSIPTAPLHTFPPLAITSSLTPLLMADYLSAFFESIDWLPPLNLGAPGNATAASLRASAKATLPLGLAPTSPLGVTSQLSSFRWAARASVLLSASTSTAVLASHGVPVTARPSTTSSVTGSAVNPLALLSGRKTRVPDTRFTLSTTSAETVDSTPMLHALHGRFAQVSTRTLPIIISPQLVRPAATEALNAKTGFSGFKPSIGCAGLPIKSSVTGFGISNSACVGAGVDLKSMALFRGPTTSAVMQVTLTKA